MEPVPPSARSEPAEAAQAEPVGPLRWHEDAEELARLRREQEDVDGTRRLLWLPAFVWLLGTSFCLGCAFMAALAGGPAVVVVLIGAVLCWLGAPMAGLVMARRADSVRGRLFYACALGLSLLPPVVVIVWAAET